MSDDKNSKGEDAVIMNDIATAIYIYGGFGDGKGESHYPNDSRSLVFA